MSVSDWCGSLTRSIGLAEHNFRGGGGRAGAEGERELKGKKQITMSSFRNCVMSQLTGTQGSQTNKIFLRRARGKADQAIVARVIFSDPQSGYSPSQELNN